MPNTRYCHHLKQELPALTTQPYPGPIGQWLFNNISKSAWLLWLTEQTKLINEERLNLAKATDRTKINEAIRAFFNIPADI